jgi:hypothetical protein
MDKNLFNFTDLQLNGEAIPMAISHLTKSHAPRQPAA